jgi:hypothetical protein
MTSESSPRIPYAARERRAKGAAALRASLVAAALSLAACATSPPAEDVREYLDEQTAATVTVGLRPMVFALERPNLAVHARDYLTLVPVDVNRAGAHQRYFYGYLWSTIDKQRVGEPEQQALRFELVADGRRVPLTPVAGKPRDLGLGEAPLPPPSATAVPLMSATTREVQEFVAVAQEIVAVAVYQEGSERFALWAR